MPFQVSFHFADRPPNIKGKRAVKLFLRELFQVEGKELRQLNYIFCSDDFLLDINRSYLNHDTYTDIITFDLSEGVGIIGEVYISTDRVRENAQMHQAKYQVELRRVLIHGALHLCGYRDKKKSEITQMREKEDYYLRLFEEKYE